jgi:hypothetical protein
MEKLHHFYHIFASGMWEVPTKEHIKELKSSGLLENLSSIHFGLIGKQEDRNIVKEYLASELKDFNICAEVDEGFEQETQDKMLEFCKKNDGYVYYAHSKNAMTLNALHVKWRKSMTFYTVVKWRETIDLLNQGFCASGSHYLIPENGRLMPLEGSIKTIRGAYGGTFWWTKAKYLRNFDPPHRKDRFGAEEWIMDLKRVVEEMEEEFKVYDFNWHHPGQDMYLVSSW